MLAATAVLTCMHATVRLVSDGMHSFEIVFFRNLFGLVAILPLALRAGIDIKIVSERLNHSSTNITREIYTHVTPPMQSDAAERVASLVYGSRAET